MQFLYSDRFCKLSHIGDKGVMDAPLKKKKNSYMKNRVFINTSVTREFAFFPHKYY